MEKVITISNVLGGWSISDYLTSPGEFLSSIGIDPDLPATDGGNKPSGYIRPSAFAKFSGANVNATPKFIQVNPKNDKIYTILDNGKFISYTKTFTSETVIATIGSCEGNGMAYYDNAIYIARNTNIAKYHRMDSSPTLDDDYWTAVLGMADLANTTYPSINGVEIPNHCLHYHADRKRLYVCDVVDNKGRLHYIQTKKVIYEGDTDDGSTYNALTFSYGEYPTCVETSGTDLVVGLIEGTDTTIKQRPAKISFWNMTSAGYSSITSVELSDPLITAIKNVNGTLYVFSGSANKGCRVSIITSGYNIKEIAYLPEVYPPLAGAVDHILNRILFGSNTTEPEISGSAFAINSQYKNFPMGLHNIARCSSTGDDPMITAVLYPTQTSAPIPEILLGWKDNSAFGIDKRSTTYADHNVWRSDIFVSSSRFSINKIRIPFAQAIVADMSLKIRVYIDNASNTPSASNKTLTTVNITNYPDGDKFITIYPEIRCDNNFFIQIENEGSILLVPALPITCKINIE